RADGGDAAAGPRHPPGVAPRGDRGSRVPGSCGPGDGPAGLHPPDFLMTTGHRDVGRLIAAYSRRAVETWAEARGLDPQKLRGPVLQKELARLLLSSSALKAALAETTEEARTALARSKLAGGKLPAQELKAQLAIDGVTEPDAVITSLMSRGLLYYERSFEGYYRAWEL